MGSFSNMKKVVLLLSGGLDSVTVLALIKSQGYEVYAISFSYGQRHLVELNAVKQIIKKFPVVDHKIVNIDLRLFGGSALTDDVDVPKSDKISSGEGEVPVTYVPARNTIFLSFALGYAESIGATDIFIGVNRLDASNYPDCRKEFVDAFERVANVATGVGMLGKGEFKIHSPLMDLNKSEIIKLGLSLGVDYSITSSCYDPSDDGLACGRCDACHLRMQGFAGLKLKDPANYRPVYPSR